MNRVFPLQSGGFKMPKGTHVHATSFEIPDTMDDLSPAVDTFCSVFHDSCLTHKTPLSSVVYGLVGPDGCIPYLAQIMSDKFRVPHSNMSIAILCTMGSKFMRMEMKRAREFLKKPDGTIGKVDVDWFIQNHDEFSFSYVCASMNDQISCDCPACIVFWAGRQAVIQDTEEEIKQALDWLCDFLDDNGCKRHGPGCVRHLIKNPDLGKWVEPDEDQEGEE